MPTLRVWWGALAGAAALALTPTADGARAQTPMSLSEALARAEGAAPDVLAASAASDAARARARQAGFRLNPEARLDVESFGGSGQYRGLDSVETTFSVGQPLEFGGKRRARVAAAEAAVQVADLQLTAARADLGRDVRDRYAEAWAAQARLQLADDTVQRAEQLATVSQLLVDAGRDPPLRALRARAASTAARSERETARAALSAAQSALSVLWGRAETGFDLAPPTPATSLPSGEFDAGRSLDVRLAEAELEAARAVIGRERSLATPTAIVEAGFRRYAETDDHAFIVSVGAPIPIRDRNQGAVAAARADALGAEVRRNQALAEAIRRVRDAESALRAATAQVAALESAGVREAEEALRLARLGYEAGKFTLLDVLDAEAALQTARSSLVQARLDRARAEAALDRAMTR